MKKFGLILAGAGVFVTGTAFGFHMSPYYDIPDQHPPVIEDFDFQNHDITNFGLAKSKTLALTFDDGPGAGTAKILDLLKKYQIKATFFSIGENGLAHMDLLRREIAEGHLVGNHSYTHPNLNLGVYKTHPAELVAELRKTDQVLQQIEPAGVNWYFRAPYGNWNPTNAGNANAQADLIKYVGPIYWDIGGEIDRDSHGHMTDSADWDCWGHHLTPAVCLTGYVAKADTLDGGVVLSHDLYADTADMWEQLFPILIAKGYKFVTLDEIHALDSFRAQAKDH